MKSIWRAAFLVEVRDALRGLRAGKGTTALACAILTLTLAAGTVTFSVVDAIALRPLPYFEADRLVGIGHTGSGILRGAAPQDFFSWRGGSRSFDGLAAAFPGAVLQIQTDNAAGEIVTARATANLFDVLGVRPMLGRSFRPDEEMPGGASGVVVLTHTAWTRWFGADRTVIGRRIRLTQRQDTGGYEIIGVLPPGVTYPITALEDVGAFVPYIATPADRNHASGARAYSLHVVGRLRPAVSLERARADVEHVSAAVRAAYPASRAAGGRPLVQSLQDRVVGPAKSWLLLVLAAVGCVLLVGCVNAASLLLARATVRARELATRAALGASRARLARTLLLEGLLLACFASAAAIVLASWGLSVAKAQLPEGLARASTIALDVRVFIASIVAALLCGLFAGGVPAWRVSRGALLTEVNGGGSVIGGGRQARSLAAFLVAEVAFVTVLLVASTLAVTTFVVVSTADLGFDRRDVMVIGVSKSMRSMARDDRPAAASMFHTEVLDRARATPGIRATGLLGLGAAPLSGGLTRYSLVIPGIGEVDGDEMFETRAVSTEYFSAMGLRVVRGRPFDANDSAGAPPVAIINDLAARRYFPGRDPVGQVVTFQGEETRIVGVLANVRLRGPEADWHTELYIPLSQAPSTFPVASVSLIVRTVDSAPATAPAVREAIQTGVAGVTVEEPQLIDDAFRRLTAGRKFNAGLMSAFGFLAVVMGAIGIYGTMTFVVAQQARAIGLRMALGASQSHVLRSILGESLSCVIIGATLGLIGARVVANLFTALVFGVHTTSLTVYTGVALALSMLGVLGSIMPARRAARLDPIATLRTE